MADFILNTGCGNKGYIAVQSGYDQCRQDIIANVRSGQSVSMEYRSFADIEAVSGRLPNDVRSKLGLQ